MLSDTCRVTGCILVTWLEIWDNPTNHIGLYTWWIWAPVTCQFSVACFAWTLFWKPDSIKTGFMKNTKASIQILSVIFRWTARVVRWWCMLQESHSLGYSWWRHQMKTFSRYWPFVRESIGHHGFPSQRPVTRSFMCLLKSASEQTV